MKLTAHIGLLLTVALLAAGCDKLEQSAATTGPRQVELRIRASQGPGSRTAPGEVGSGVQGTEQPIVWSADDAFAVWAIDQTSQELALDRTRFALHNYGGSFSEADFVASAPEMADGTYTYYALYPYSAVAPAQTQIGGVDPQIRFTVPAEQRGDYDASADIMFARSEGKALTGHARDESIVAESGVPQLTFRHLTHLLRIEIVANGLSAPIGRIDICFPDGTAVSGSAVFDPTVFETDAPDGPQAEEISAGIRPIESSNRITLLPDEPIEAGTSRYLWVHLLPCTVQELAQIKFRAYDTNGLPSQLMRANILDPAGRTFAAEHISPVALQPTPLEPQAITFSCPDTEAYPNFLGETATKLIITGWPEEPIARPVEAADGLPYTLQLEAGKGTLHFYYDAEEPAVNLDLQGTIEVGGYESSSVDLQPEKMHGIYRLAFPDNMMNSKEAYFAVPYLFFEDFSNVETFSSDDEHATWVTGDKSAYTFLNGWSGGRCGAVAGTSIRIACRRETSARYDARVDSAPIGTLKDNAISTVSISYDYGANRQNGGLQSANVGQTVYMGYVTAPDAYRSGSTTGTFDTQFSINEQTGSWTNLPHTGTFGISDCTSQTRLSWRTVIDYNAGLGNSTCWLYIDNVKVSIGSEVKHPDLDYRTYFPIE